MRSASYSHRVQSVMGGSAPGYGYDPLPQSNPSTPLVQHPAVQASPTAAEAVAGPQCHQGRHMMAQHQRSFALGQYRRHAASLSCAPIRGSAFSSNEGIETRGFTRAASWAPESPKKRQAYYLSNANDSKSRVRRVCSCLSGGRWINHKMLRNNKKEFIGWFLLACLIIVGYKFFSDGSFSAILTLASAFQCFSLVLLNLKVVTQQSISGVSQRSIVLIITCLVFRLASTLFYNGYLPVDRSGDWVYQGADVLSVALGTTLLVYARRYCRATVDAQKDKDTCAVLVPLVIIAILAMCLHPTLNQNVLADFAWTFGLYVETYAMVPQLFMMGKSGGEVEGLTSHYVASMAASKLFAFLFWYFSYAELAPRNGGRNVVGWAVILTYSAQTILFADFFYYYVKSIRIGRKLVIGL